MKIDYNKVEKLTELILCTINYYDPTRLCVTMSSDDWDKIFELAEQINDGLE